MNRKAVVILLVSAVLISAVAMLYATADFSERKNGDWASVTVTGYTNTVVGIPKGTYAGTNHTTGRFALLRVENLTRRSFIWYFGPVVFVPRQDGRPVPDGISLLPSQASGKLSGKGMITFAVPEPEFPEPWKAGVVLEARNSCARLPTTLMRLAQRVGIETRDEARIAWSPELSK